MSYEAGYTDETPEAFDLGEDVFATSELPVPPAIPDAHRGTIEAVSVKQFDNEKQTVAIEIKLKSLDVPTLETEFLIFPPRGFIADIKVNASTLPEEEGNKQQSSFRMSVANSDGSATLQKLRLFASEAGRTSASVGAGRSTNFTEFVENHAKLLTGLEVVFYRRADDGDDERFKNRLRVKGIMSIETVNNPKLLKKYKKVWEQEQ